MQKRRLAAVLVLDLDGFKEINDLFGHSYGDYLLKRVALRLSSVLRDYDVVARTGGDEFVLLLPEIEQPSIAMVVAEKLIAGASENVEHQGRSLRLHASVGLALFPSDGHDFERCSPRPTTRCMPPRPRARTATSLRGCRAQSGRASRLT